MFVACCPESFLPLVTLTCLTKTKYPPFVLAHSAFLGLQEMNLWSDPDKTQLCQLRCIFLSLRSQKASSCWPKQDKRLEIRNNMRLVREDLQRPHLHLKPVTEIPSPVFLFPSAVRTAGWAVTALKDYRSPLNTHTHTHTSHIVMKHETLTSRSSIHHIVAAAVIQQIFLALLQCVCVFYLRHAALHVNIQQKQQQLFSCFPRVSPRTNVFSLIPSTATERCREVGGLRDTDRQWERERVREGAREREIGN